jgi:hypothetical protein
MIDRNKIEDAIDSYFKNTLTAKIIENLDRHAIDRKKDLERENFDRIPVTDSIKNLYVNQLQINVSK